MSKFERKKPAPIIIKGEFDDFGEGLAALCTFHEDVNDIFKCNHPDDPESHTYLEVQEAVKLALDFINTNTPDLLDKKNIHCSLNLTSNKCMIKTENFVSFGWEIFYTVEKGKAVIDYTTFTFVILNGNEELANTFVNSGWNMVEREKK